MPGLPRTRLAGKKLLSSSILLVKVGNLSRLGLTKKEGSTSPNYLSLIDYKTRPYIGDGTIYGSLVRVGDNNR